VKLSNATSKNAVASETSLAALPSPPLSECELETEIADAVLEATITVNPAKSNLETDRKLAKRLNLDADWMGTSQVYATQAAYTQASVRITKFKL